MRRWLFLISYCIVPPGLPAADPVASMTENLPQPDSASVAFFERRIRPVLIEHCYKCHSAEAGSAKANLRLDLAAGLRQGGDSGPAVVPGQPDDSLLLLSLRYESFEMPPAGRLSQRVIADFEKWIRDGAVDLRTDADSPAAGAMPDESTIDIAAGRNFWAFQPPQLSPTIESTDDLASRLRDSDRIDFLVDRRLAELGITANGPTDRRTLLRRLSFDLIGLPPDPERVDAQLPDPSSADANDATDPVQSVPDIVDALLNSPAFGQRWARLWLDIARYAEDQAHIVGGNKSLFYPNAWRYRDWVIQAFNDDMPYDRFIQLQLAADAIEPNNVDEHAALGFIGLGPKYYRRNDPKVMAEEWEDRVDVVSRGLQGLTVACARCHDHKYDPIATEDYYALAGVFASTEMFNKPLNANVKLDGSKNARDPAESLHVIRDAKLRDLAVMIRGQVNNTGDVVPRGFLQVAFEGPRREFHDGSGRLELAMAISDPANPLTARVIVNRVWREYFGRGLVGTPSNFGQLGERPSNPELLDDLAVRFMQNGWSLKWLHRQIVLSRTYQRSSEISAASTADPENLWLWRMPRRRLSVETWRDAVLLAAGRLDVETGGPSIRPDDPDETRRTIYASVSRFELNPLLARFDFPDPNTHAARRVETNTPLQKLFLLNNPFMLAQADRLADRAASAAADGEAIDPVSMLFRLALQRSPDVDEHRAATTYLGMDTNRLSGLAQALLASNEFWYLD